MLYRYRKAIRNKALSVIKLISTLIILTLLVACGKQTLTNPKVVTREGLEYLAESEQPLTADIVMWYDNGQLEKKYTLINGKKEGLEQRWNTNGRLSREINNKSGKKDGLVRAWDANGRLTEDHWRNGEHTWPRREWYSNGQLLKEGKPIDKNDESIIEYRHWYENGQLMMVSLYKNKKRHGVKLVWSEDGLLESEITYNNGDVEDAAQITNP